MNDKYNINTIYDYFIDTTKIVDPTILYLDEITDIESGIRLVK